MYNEHVTDELLSIKGGLKCMPRATERLLRISLRVLLLRGALLLALLGSTFSVFAQNSSCITQPQSYVLTDLGSLGASAIPTAVNNKGQVTGYSGDLGGSVGGKPIRAFLWQTGTLTNLGTLPGDIDSW